jgi:hypothetical protein
LLHIALLVEIVLSNLSEPEQRRGLRLVELVLFLFSLSVVGVAEPVVMEVAVVLEVLFTQNNFL